MCQVSQIAKLALCVIVRHVCHNAIIMLAFLSPQEDTCSQLYIIETSQNWIKFQRVKYFVQRLNGALYMK